MRSGKPKDARDTILDFLGRVDRRLRWNESLRGLSRALWGLVGLLILLKLAGLWSQPSARSTLLALYGLGLAGYLLWFHLRKVGLSRSALVADRRADLKDATRSAYSFLSLDRRTDWMDFQIGRTAARVEGLKVSELAPTSVPRPIFYASGIAMVLVALFAWSPTWLTNLEAREFFVADGAEEEPVEELFSEEGEAGEPERQAELEELEEAIERLRQQDIELSESLRDLGEAREALSASRAEQEQLEMDLGQLGESLEATPALGELAEALKARNPEEAAELLRELAERMADAPNLDELEALMESLRNADLKQMDFSELMESLENAGELSASDLTEMVQALEQAAGQLEELGERMAASQQPGESMGQQELEALPGQQQAPGQQQMGEQQQQQGGQAMQTAGGMTSTQLQMARLQGDPSSAVPVDAGPAGDTTGPGGGEEPVLGEATSLDVQLEMEVLKTQERDEPIPEEVFERLSREEKSTLSYQSVQQRESYAEESALGSERVPWPYRSLVKRYFLTILANSEANSESSPEK